MFIEYPTYYRRNGVRTVLHLFKARITAVDNLPKYSLLHWANMDHLRVDPEDVNPVIDPATLMLSKDYWLFKEYKKFFYVDYTTDYTSPSPHGRRKALALNPLIKKFHLKNRRYLFMKEAHKLIDSQMSLIVQHYDYMHMLYRYMKSPLVAYHKWYDFTYTFFQTVGKMLSESDRHQFYVIDTPKDLPGYAILNMYQNREPSATLLNIFNDPYKLLLLEIYKWLDPEEMREKSLLNMIPQEHIHKFNLIFRTPDGMSSILNLGYLNSFIKGQPNTTSMNSVAQVNPTYLKKIFLVYLNQLSSQTMKVQEIADAAVDAPVDDTPSRDTTTQPDVEVDDVLAEGIDYDRIDDMPAGTVDEDGDIADVTHNAAPEPADPDPEPIAIILEDDDEETDLDLSVDVDELLKEVDEILETSEKAYNRKLKAKGVKTDKDGNITVADPRTVRAERISKEREIAKKRYFENEPIDERMRSKADELLDEGFLTSREFSTYMKKLTDVEIKPVEMPEQLPVGVTVKSPVAEKSYTNNSVDAFATNYTAEVLQTDIDNMIKNTQRAFVAVRKVEKNTVSSVLGEYEAYSLTLDPIDGVQSTVHFKIPKLDKDGYFTVNGKKNILRKQIVDMPIRKITPSRVQLSSYYGKTFVTRSRTKSDSYIYRIMKRIALEVDPQAYINKVALGHMYQYDTEYPYVIGQLANQYRSIQTQDFILDLAGDDTRLALASDYEPLKAQLLSKQMHLVGHYHDDKSPIVCAMDNTFYRIQDSTPVPLGELSDLLKIELPRYASYSDYASIRIYSKEIPLAIVLLHFTGLSTILANQNVRHELLETKAYRSSDRTKYAFSITFRDMTLVIHRDNTQANLLLMAGLLSAAKQLTKYEYSDLDDKDQIVSLYLQLGYNAAYIKEIESQEALFVDPITASVLESINEPTLYLPLLIRANELLVDYSCPHPQNISGMRIRGNERIAGYIYKELSYAIRDYRNRNISHRSKVEISPYKVWNTIVKDNTVKLAEETNPIQTLKEKELVTYVGEGGRSKESMPKNTRVFHESFAGVISEASVDSSDVGINSYLSPGTRLKNIRGVVEQTDSQADLTSMVSTSALLAPFSLNDDQFV